jgi:hypothetical protein
MNARGQRETGGALGTFCVSCHAPMAVAEGATTDGLNLDSVPQKLRGVTCFFCHSVDSVNGAHNDPLHLASDLVMRGPISDPATNAAHAAKYSLFHDRDRVDSASMCGACHDITTQHGAALERTYAEWQASVFAHAPGGATCGQCHMAQSSTLQPIASAPGLAPRRLHAHTFAAIDTALTTFPNADKQKTAVQSLLDTTLQSALCVSTQGPPQIRVLLENVAAGHGFPSGAAQDRRVWVEVVAYSGANVVYQSGVVADGTSPVASADPDRWLLRDCIFDETGKEVRMFWQAASYESNALLGQATFDTLDPRFYQTHVAQSFPRGGGSLSGPVDRVTMRVRVQPIGIDVLDDLVTSGDLDPKYKAAMTTLDVGSLVTWTSATATTTYMEDRTPLSCITTTSFNVAADKVPATNHVKCAP